MPITHTYTYTTLEIGAMAFNHILGRIKKAGPEYVERYYSEKEEKGMRMIHFPGAEVALVTPLNEKN